MGTSDEIVKKYLYYFIFALVIPCTSLYLLGYETLRANTYRLWLLQAASLLPFLAYRVGNFTFSFKEMLGLGVLYRIVLLFSLPALSDDYFRFIWDGRLFSNGINPFLHLPKFYFENGYPATSLNTELFFQLNSPNYFTIYPPVCQYIFSLGALISPTSILDHVVVMRIAFTLAEGISIFFIHKLLQHYRLPPQNLMWYALNPLVVLELVGNLHFETFMILGVLGSLYFLIVKDNILVSALFFAIAINAKLLPLMFLPLFFFPLNFKKAIAFYGLIGIFILLMFTPFLSLEMIENIGRSIGLYFNKFEFNASLYYIVRWFGFQIKGYNIIGIAGKVLSYIPIIYILLLSIINVKNLGNICHKITWVLTIYFISATIVHPWYIIPILAISLFTPYHFPKWWLILAMLSYATYQDSSYTENLWLVAIEYTITFSVMGYELWHKSNQVLKTGLDYVCHCLCTTNDS